jgi:hypothetical protein
MLPEPSTAATSMTSFNVKSSRHFISQRLPSEDIKIDSTRHTCICTRFALIPTFPTAFGCHLQSKITFAFSKITRKSIHDVSPTSNVNDPTHPANKTLNTNAATHNSHQTLQTSARIPREATRPSSRKFTSTRSSSQIPLHSIRA